MDNYLTPHKAAGKRNILSSSGLVIYSRVCIHPIGEITKDRFVRVSATAVH